VTDAKWADLEALAKAAASDDDQWVSALQNFNNACSPDTILALLAELAQAKQDFETVQEMQKYSTPADPTGVRNGLRFKAIEAELAQARAERDAALSAFKELAQARRPSETEWSNLEADNARLTEIDKAWAQSQENADPELVLTGGILHMLLTQYGEQQQENARLRAACEAAQDFIDYIDNPKGSVDVEERKQRKAAEALRAALAAPEPK
jgi:hypothetical protein